ncbi:glutaminase [Stagonosporopsis vannaccii]|nr:glutaminase [Stagonosporopsis vannaccii]
MLALFVTAFSYLLSVISSESVFIPARPPSIPLAVKSPYLSAWLPAGTDGGNGGYLPGQWPQFYTGQTLGWTGLVRVDNETFTWMGAPKDIQVATQTAAEYTATRSIFTIDIGGKVALKATFLSPLTPRDRKRQSLVSSYLDIELMSIDRQEHDVQIYTDVSAEWISGDVSAEAMWDFGLTDDVVYHRLSKRDQQVFSEVRDRAEWGNFYYAADSRNAVTYQSGADDDVRGAFVARGRLKSSNDTNYRAINDHWPIFGYAIELGRVGPSAVSTLFSLGLYQDEAIQFVGADGLTVLPSLWTDYFADDLEAHVFFHQDFEESAKLSSDLDNQILEDSITAAGQDYAVLTTLAARQAFAATQLVGTEDKHYLFLKEISSNGNTQTVDVIYPTSPIFLYTDPELVRLLLDPHFENQENGHYPNKWAMHDLGAHYPNATGHPGAYVQRTGNTNYIAQHYPVLTQWASYLIDSSLYPAEQLSTDDFAGHLANQTNLALKGIIGIEAMSQLALLIGETADAETYTTIAHDYISRWQTLARDPTASPSHTMLNYANASSWGLLYNLFADRLLSTHLVPQEVYDMQSAFYPTVRESYGVPLDTRHEYLTKADWEMFSAAVAADKTRDMFVRGLARWVNETRTSRPWTDLYHTGNGGFPGAEFKARPVVGGVFALLV